MTELIEFDFGHPYPLVNSSRIHVFNAKQVEVSTNCNIHNGPRYPINWFLVKTQIL